MRASGHHHGIGGARRTDARSVHGHPPGVEMAQIQPEYWAFLVGQAIEPEKRTLGERSKRTSD